MRRLSAPAAMVALAVIFMGLHFWLGEFWQLGVQFLILAGVLRALGVQAFEEDQERIKRELADLRAATDLVLDRTDRIQRRLPE